MSKESIKTKGCPNGLPIGKYNSNDPEKIRKLVFLDPVLVFGFYERRHRHE